MVVYKSLGGSLVILLGVLTFVDVWQSGIYKLPGKKSLTNLSPLGWSITMMGMFIIVHPVYLLSRKKLRTKEAATVYFILMNVLAAIGWLSFTVKIFMYLSGNGFGRVELSTIPGVVQQDFECDQAGGGLTGRYAINIL